VLDGTGGGGAALDRQTGSCQRGSGNGSDVIENILSYFEPSSPVFQYDDARLYYTISAIL